MSSSVWPLRRRRSAQMRIVARRPTALASVVPSVSNGRLIGGGRQVANSVAVGAHRSALGRAEGGVGRGGRGAWSAPKLASALSALSMERMRSAAGSFTAALTTSGVHQAGVEATIQRRGRARCSCHDSRRRTSTRSQIQNQNRRGQTDATSCT